HAPRPPNAFILFRRHWQPSVTANNPHVDTRQISRILGKMWNDADHSEKERFRKLSKEVKVEHEKLYPGYKYSRRK
ncbi:MAG: sequence-specific DNA-binding high mobility group box protein, partial [Piptocephalis tieghemiana]